MARRYKPRDYWRDHYYRMITIATSIAHMKMRRAPNQRVYLHVKQAENGNWGQLIVAPEGRCNFPKATPEPIPNCADALDLFHWMRRITGEEPILGDSYSVPAYLRCELPEPLAGGLVFSIREVVSKRYYAGKADSGDMTLLFRDRWESA